MKNSKFVFFCLQCWRVVVENLTSNQKKKSIKEFSAKALSVYTGNCRENFFRRNLIKKAKQSLVAQKLVAAFSFVLSI